MPELFKRVTYNKYSFIVFPEVYCPAEDTFLLADHLIVEKDMRVLDMCTGCGILGILAAENARSVLAVDLNPYAVKCTKMNIKLNGFEDKMDVVRGDLFQPLKPDEKFDFIVFNPPYLPTLKEELSGDWLEKSWNGGPSGREVIDSFLSEVKHRLTKGGTLLFVHSEISDAQQTMRVLRKEHLRTEVLAELSFAFERIILFRATKDTN